jgi:hypothetical protein
VYAKAEIANRKKIWDKLDKMRAAILFVFYVASPLANICPPLYILCSLDAFPTPIYPPSLLPPSSLTQLLCSPFLNRIQIPSVYQRELNSKRYPFSFTPLVPWL